MREHFVILRAVARGITGVDVLYTAAETLRFGTTAATQRHNQAVCEMTARLLGLPSPDLKVIERVLRDLPPR